MIIDCRRDSPEDLARCRQLAQTATAPIVIIHPRQSFVECVGGDASGQVHWLPPDIGVRSLRDRLYQLALTAASTENVPDEQPRLSLRERQIAARIAKGHGYKHIAEALSIAESTVKSHAKNIKAKLGLDPKADLGAALRGETSRLMAD